MSIVAAILAMFSQPSDTTNPTVEISCSQTGPTSTSPLNFTFTFSESVTGFTVDDITVGNGSKSNFSGSGTTYTCDVTPTASGNVTVDVAAGVAQDGAGNTNDAAIQFSITAVTFEHLDNFVTTASAPLTTPRTAEPGPGTAVLVDSGNKYSITGGTLTPSGSATGASDPTLRTSSNVRVGGLAGSFKLALNPSNGSSIYAAFYNNTTITDANIVGGMLFVGAGGPSSLRVLGLDTGENFAATQSNYYIICRSSGGFFFVFNNVLLGIAGTNTTSPIYFAFHPRGVFALPSVETMRVSKLPAPWTTDFGIADALTASPTSGSALTHSADGTIEFNWTVATSETMELSVRRTDDDNRWIIRCSQGGSTVKIIERAAGVETERASTAQTFTNATTYKIMVKLFGNKIYAFVNDVAKGSYTSATFNNTATGGKVSGFATGANFAAFPRTLSGTALSVLQTFSP